MKNRITSFLPSRTFSSPFSRLPLSYLLLTFLTLFAGSVASAQIPSSGLVGYWPFNGNANDESGNGNNGTVNGATLTTDRFGNANSAYSFDGVNDFINVPTSNSLNISTSSITISAWLKLDGDQLGYSGILSKMDNNGIGHQFVVGNNSGLNRLATETAGISGSAGALGNVNLNDGNWHNVVYVLDRALSEIRFYVDGSADIYINNSVLSSLNLSNNSNVLIGVERYFIAYFGGIIDDISFYNRALTPAEITQLYTDQTSTVSAPPCPTLATNLQTGLVGYWPFCGNANDESGNGNNGTVNGATLTTDRFGNANSAYSFDGGGTISIPHNPNLGFMPNDEFTASFWFYTINSTFPQHFMGKRPYNSNVFNWQFLSGTNWNTPEYSFASGLAVNTYSGAFAYQNLDVGQWVHLTGVYNNGNWKLYRNGVQIAETQNVLASNDVVCNLLFGNSGNFQPFFGKLDDISIYNRALTPSEITQLYTNPSTTPPVACTPFLGEDQTVCAGTGVTLSASGSSLACPTLPATLQNGLVGYWPFCGNANDASGNGNNGTVNGATLTTDRFGNASSAYSFDGVDDFIQCPSTISNLATATISGWAFCNSLFGGQFVHVGEDNNTNCNGIGIGKGGFNPLPGIGGGLNFWNLFQGNKLISLVSCVNYYDSGHTLTNGVWFHYAMVKQNNLFLYYINGALVGTSTILPAINPTNKIFIGCSGSGGPPTVKTFFSGQLDEVSIHNRALSAIEIQQLYTLGQSTYLWSTGATTATINVTPTTTTTYTCTVTDANGNVCTDSVTVFVPQIEATDLTICTGESTTLSVSGINSTATPSACPTLPSNLQTGLVGYWPFCGNANDVSGNGNNGTVNGATLTTDRFGNSNSAYSFDGVNDIIDVPNSSAFSIFGANQPSTISFWAKRSNNSDGYIICKGLHTPGCNLGNKYFNVLWVSTNGLLYNLYNSTTMTSVQSGSSYDLLNQWNHVAIVRNAQTKLYINGIDVSSNVSNAGWGVDYNSSLATNLTFGAKNNVSANCANYFYDYFFNGNLDEVSIHSRALSVAEIQQLYTLGQSTYLWSTGATTATINVTPTTTTTYTCTVTDANGNVCTDSVTVFVPQIEATDLTICAGETTTLSVSGINSTATPSACPTLPTNLQTGLVGYWPFCGNANDESGNGNNGTVNGATLTTDRFGSANNAYSFDGVNDNVVVPNSPSFQTNTWTINAWFKTSFIGYNRITSKDVSGASNDFSLIILNGNLYISASLNGVSNNPFPICTEFVADDTWHNVNATRANGYFQISIDGIFCSTVPDNFGNLINSNSLYIGSPSNYPTQYFNGKLDDIIIYNRALTATEIQQLYTLGQTTYLWSNGATTPTINVSPTTTTTYTCTVTTNGVSCTDSVTVVVSNPVIDLGADVTVCGNSTTLTAPSGYDSYLWSNGGTTNTTTVNANGTYSCTATQGGCSASDSIDVTLIDATIITSDSTICAGETVTLSVPQGGSSSAACATLPINLQTGLVGYWPFCGNANDASGNGNNGTVNGATLTTDRFGNANNAYSFDGIPDRIDLGQNLGVPIGSPNSSWSCSAWINRNNYNAVMAITDYLGAGGGNDNYVAINLQVDQSVANAGIRSGSTDYNVTGGTITANQWHLIAFTVSQNGLMSLYVDGQIITSTSINSSLNFYENPTYRIGASAYAGNYNLGTGLIDNVTVHNRALSLAEIQQLYTLGQTTYLWSNGATTPTINVSPTTTTTYTCTVTTNGVSCTDSVTVVVSQPVASITPNGIVEICQGQSIALTANGGTSYLWNTGAPTQSITVNTEGLYTVTATDANGCTDTESQFVKVNFLPNIGVNNASICPGQSTTLTATGGLSYVWSPATGLSSTTGTTVTASPSTSIVYTVTGTGANGCTNTATAAVSVNAAPAATITPASATTFCQGGSVVLNANTGTGLSYQWFNNAVAISGATTSSYAANASGSYTVVVTNTSTCSATSTATVVTVNALPTSTITPATATTFCQGGSVVLNSNTGAGLSYQWRLNGTNITGATSSSYTANASGSYTVVVTNTSTCSATSSATVVTVNALPTATITPATATTFCQGGSVVLTANTGAGLSYQWRLNGTNITGATTSSYTANASGSYTVVVTNTSTCLATSTATVVTVNALPTSTITASSATTFCQGGSVVLTANTGTGLSYQWFNNAVAISGAASSSYTANASGSYTVVVTNTSTCSATSTATVVTVNALPTATITPATATTFCQGGSVVLNANTGTGLTYQWRLNGNPISGATSSSYTANASGSYTVVVTNTSTCSATSAATVVTVNALPTATITPATATTFCQGGSVVLNANTGTGLTYQWFNNATAISGATSASYTATTNGSYTVVVTNTSTCSATSTATVVTVNALPTSTITPATATTFCQGGSVVMNANTGTGLTYQWRLNGTNITGATTSSYTSNASGSYTVVVTNTSTCAATSSATVVTVNALPTATITPATATTFCQGGSVVLTANTGTGLSYQWYNNASAISGATSSSYTANASGSYTVVVTNTSTCAATSTATVVTVNALPTATITASSATTFCQGGSVVLTANTGTGLSYQWRLNGTNITGATSSSYTANASGSYTVVVTNTSTCSATSTATVVTVNALPTATITAATATTFCEGGSVVLNANTGAGLTYQWRLNGTNITGATTSTYTANASGSYTVVVTNTSTCSATSTATVVTVNALPTATITPATATTFCQGGSVVLNANTGAGLSYQWRLNGTNITGATSSSYTANASGSYTVVVTNTSTCSATSTATVVTVNALPTATITPAAGTTFCQGGSVVLNANTGTGLSYQWFNNAVAISGATTSSYTANASGSYTVIVTNTSICSATSTATVVTVNALPTATITPATATTFCQGGSVVLNANTGAGLTYQWRLNGTNITEATSSSYTANASGSYTVVVTNTSTCSATSTATIVTVNALPTATITPATTTTFCQGGSVVLNANTGTGLSYQWFNNATAISGATTSNYTANASGSYTVVVTNTSTCSATSTATVVTVNALPTATNTAATATTFCQGGSVVLNANTGAGLSYQWRLNGTNITGATTSSYTANASGSYTVVVTNTSTCSATSSATVVTVNALPTATITPATATTFCQGGSVVLNANTGAGLSYQWRLNGTNITGATSSSYTANASGSYTVVVTNTSTCSATSTATVVTVNALPTATITPAAGTTFCQGGSVVLNANTGTGLSYQWFNNATAISGATTSNYTANASGSYTVVVTNTSTCSATSTATVVTVNPLPTSTITASSATTFCQGSSVVLTANTGAGLSYQWFNNAVAISGATASSYTANASGSYTVVVTNTSTCAATSTATVVTVNALPIASISPNGLVEICEGQSIALTANGGVSYLWSTGAPTQSITVNTEALYTVTVTDINGCTDTESQFVKVNQLPNIAVNNASICAGQSATLTATGGLSYVWSPATGLSATTGSTVSSSTTTNAAYTVTGTGANGCTNSATAMVTVNALPTATITPATATTFCQGGSVVLNANNGAGLSYQWRLNGTNITGATTSTYTANASGSYTVVVTNTSTCAATSTATVVTVIPNVNYYADADGDGFGDAATLVSTCVQPQGYVTDNTDCDDTSADVNPAANEVCNHIDDDCSGAIDDGLVFDTYYADVDGDTFGDANNSIYECSQPSGYVTNNTDCNDNNANQNTASTEICNGEDDDCDGVIDNGIIFLDYYADLDSDGFGAGAATNSCVDLGAGYVTNNTDCNDNNVNQSAASTEICNGEDDDCDGAIDNGITFLDYYADADGDGFGAGDVISSCSDLGTGYVTNNTDCDDSNSNTNPNATETCNSIDDNCDGQTDEGVQTVYFVDNDGDTYGNPSVSILACTQPIGYTPDDTDCNDTDANINPGAEDIGGNGIDENCDGEIDNSIFELNATISLYPNPTRSELNIQVNSSIIGNDLYIFDAVGKLVFKQQLLSTQTTIPVSNFADGNYVVRIGEVVKRFEVIK